MVQRWTISQAVESTDMSRLYHCASDWPCIVQSYQLEIKRSNVLNLDQLMIDMLSIVTTNTTGQWKLELSDTMPLANRSSSLWDFVNIYSPKIFYKHSSAGDDTVLIKGKIFRSDAGLSHLDIQMILHHPSFSPSSVKIQVGLKPSSPYDSKNIIDWLDQQSHDKRMLDLPLGIKKYLENFKVLTTSLFQHQSFTGSVRNPQGLMIDRHPGKTTRTRVHLPNPEFHFRDLPSSLVHEFYQRNSSMIWMISQIQSLHNSSTTSCRKSAELFDILWCWIIQRSSHFPSTMIHKTKSKYLMYYTQSSVDIDTMERMYIPIGEFMIATRWKISQASISLYRSPSYFAISVIGEMYLNLHLFQPMLRSDYELVAAHAPQAVHKMEMELKLCDNHFLSSAFKLKQRVIYLRSKAQYWINPFGIAQNLVAHDIKLSQSQLFHGINTRHGLEKMDLFDKPFKVEASVIFRRRIQLKSTFNTVISATGKMEFHYHHEQSLSLYGTIQFTFHSKVKTFTLIEAMYVLAANGPPTNSNELPDFLAPAQVSTYLIYSEKERQIHGRLWQAGLYQYGTIEIFGTKLQLQIVHLDSSRNQIKFWQIHSSPVINLNGLKCRGISGNWSVPMTDRRSEYHLSADQCDVAHVQLLNLRLICNELGFHVRIVNERYFFHQHEKIQQRLTCDIVWYAQPKLLRFIGYFHIDSIYEMELLENIIIDEVLNLIKTLDSTRLLSALREESEDLKSALDYYEEWNATGNWRQKSKDAVAFPERINTWIWQAVGKSISTIGRKMDQMDFKKGMKSAYRFISNIFTSTVEEEEETASVQLTANATLALNIVNVTFNSSWSNFRHRTKIPAIALVKLDLMNRSKLFAIELYWNLSHRESLIPYIVHHGPLMDFIRNVTNGEMLWPLNPSLT